MVCDYIRLLLVRLDVYLAQSTARYREQKHFNVYSTGMIFAKLLAGLPS